MLRFIRICGQHIKTDIVHIICHILDPDGLNKLSKEHQNNPIIDCLNTNTLRNKINDLRKIC